jgi:hypothetical protein
LPGTTPVDRISGAADKQASGLVRQPNGVGPSTALNRL